MVRKHPHTKLIERPVTTIMNAPVYSVPEDVALSDVLTAMVRTGRRHLAVIDAKGHCHGVVGDRAVAAAWAEDPSTMAYRPVRQLLDPRPSIVGAEATIGDVASQMHMDGVDAVAVIDRTGCPVGMVTGSDLIALMAAATHEESTTNPVDPTPSPPHRTD